MSWKSVIVIFIIFFFTFAVAVNTDSNNSVYVFLISGVTSITVAFADAYGNSKIREPKEDNQEEDNENDIY